MKFTKMHGIGNDYIYINCFEETLKDPATLSQKISDRHFGVGSDGIILIGPSDQADFSMDLYNADGCRGMMCGNGIRCVGKYVYDHKLTDKTEISIMTGAGLRSVKLNVENGTVKSVRADMDRPDFTAANVPMIAETEEVIGQQMEFAGSVWTVTGVSMGNSHLVVLVDDPEALDLAKIGPLFEFDPRFPMRVNTDFVSVLDRKNINMRVWERGSGETLACGTGACASAAALARMGLTDDTVTVHLRGGDLLIEWDRKADRIYMTGPAQEVYEGYLDETAIL